MFYLVVCEVLEYSRADLLLKAMLKDTAGTKAEVTFSTGRFGMVNDHIPHTVCWLNLSLSQNQLVCLLFCAW